MTDQRDGAGATDAARKVARLTDLAGRADGESCAVATRPDAARHADGDDNAVATHRWRGLIDRAA